MKRAPRSTVLVAVAAVAIWALILTLPAQAAQPVGPANLGMLIGIGAPTCWNVQVVDNCQGGKCGHGTFNPLAHLTSGTPAELEARYGIPGGKFAGDCNGGEAMGGLDSLCAAEGWPDPCESIENFNDAHLVATAPAVIAATLAALRGGNTGGGAACPPGQLCQPPPAPWCAPGFSCQPFPAPPACPAGQSCQGPCPTCPTPPPPLCVPQALLTEGPFAQQGAVDALARLFFPSKGKGELRTQTLPYLVAVQDLLRLMPVCAP
jgi:hypothetical protein